MSLYEQFYSDINKDFMFNMIKDIIQKDTKFDISIDSTNYDHFLSTFDKVFNDNHFEEIEQANKLLLDTNINYFLKNIQQRGNNIETDLETLLKERERQDKSGEVEETSTSIEEVVQEIKEVKEVKEVMDVKEVKEVKEVMDVKEEMISTNFNSSQRININSSRYNYKIDSRRHNIKINHSISRVILPIEDSYLFTIPILNLLIPELDYNIHIQQEKVIEGGNRTYGVYQAIQDCKIKNTIPERITIDIRDITGKRYISSDILKVNILEIKKGRIYFTCSLINHNDYETKDYIKIINNNSNTLFHVLQEPLKIKKIQGNIIICEYLGLIDLEDDIYTNIDMKIMNMSNQNIFYLN
tara:strand:- start:9995 stop:11059 length:1065 start_codon:yes stop_codon:yes gene_type:complete